MNTPSTLSQCLLKSRLLPENKVAIQYKKNNEWQKINWKKYYEMIENLGLGLKELNVKKGDKVAIYSNTRFEWSLSDNAIIGIGAITVPIYQTSTIEDLEFILNNCEAKVIILENKSLLKNVNQIRTKCPFLEKIIIFEDVNDAEMGTSSFEDILEQGIIRKSNNENEFIDVLNSSKPEDIISIVYTSGTTGLPKGVVLTHEQAISEVSEAFTYVGANTDDVSLSFLPYAHILGRVEHWGHLYVGCTLAFAESIEKLKGNLIEVRPTLMIAVPRIFEKVYTGILAQIESNPLKSQLFKWALEVGKKVSQLKIKREAIPLALLVEYKLAQKLVLDKITNAFGGRLRFAISGGAPLPKDIALFFHACNVLILEGYGLTETTAAICVNAPFDYVFSTVGKPLSDVQIKIAEDGEILVKSKKVMKEYYKNPTATNESFEDGWFKTGDIGEILSTGQVKITDRKKDLIKTAGGKYVAPQKLENLLKAHSFLSNVLIHGDQKKYIVALLTLDKGFVINFAKEKNLQYKDYSELTQNSQLLEYIRKAVASTNSQLASFETIKRFTVLPSEFSIEAGELTPSMKVKRKVLDKKFSKEIEALYT